MRVSLRWLKEYVDIPCEVDELAERLTMAGLEVESVEPLGSPLDRVYVGEVTAVREHPNADNLRLCTVNAGTEETTLVCGAPNVYQGMKAPVALEGALLPNGMEIKAVKIRGELSRGMLCSEVELGIGEDASGLMELPKDAKVGEPLVSALGLDDQILDIAVYANRPDCMSMLGIAREVAALVGGKLKVPTVDLNENDEDISNLTSVVVEDSEKCPRYSARLIKNIQIGESPLWMQAKLRAAGMRPINNVVDITNFVMLETGQPLHAFDFDKLAERRLVIRTAKPGEELVTLDGEQRKLDPDMLMICDAGGPVCIAGVMGGENSEVTAGTTNILLESANFASVTIRRTARRLGIPSEAAARFEKGIAPEGTILALNRAAKLLAEYASGTVVSGIIDQNSANLTPATIGLRPERVNHLLGVEIPREQMKSILTDLEFGVDDKDATWRVTVPAVRRDIELEEDLIEEIARLYGFVNIPATLPKGANTQGGQALRLQIADQLREILAGAGLNEAYNYTFVNPRLLDKVGYPQEHVARQMIQVQNPLTEDFSVMRTTLIPGLVESVARNSSRQQEQVALFEIGSVYLPCELPLKQQPTEQTNLGIALMGSNNEVHWDVTSRAYDFYDLKGLVELVLSNFVGDFQIQKGSHPSLHPGRQGEIVLDGKTLGVFGELHPEIYKAYKLTERALVGEIYLESLLPYYRFVPEFKALPKYPSMQRDLALLLSDQIPAKQVSQALAEAAGEYLVDLEIFDVYQGKQVPTGMKSLAFAFRFQGERTLTDEEINQAMDRIVSVAKEKFGAEIR